MHAWIYLYIPHAFCICPFCIRLYEGIGKPLKELNTDNKRLIDMQSKSMAETPTRSYINSHVFHAWVLHACMQGTKGCAAQDVRECDQVWLWDELVLGSCKATASFFLHVYMCRYLHIVLKIDWSWYISAQGMEASWNSGREGEKGSRSTGEGEEQKGQEEEGWKNRGRREIGGDWRWRCKAKVPRSI